MKEHHSITHIEIPAPDLEKAMTFYAQVFKWEIEIMIPDEYALFKISDLSGGGFSKSLLPAPEGTGPQVVIDVEDIDDMLILIDSKGGTVTLPKTEIGSGHGFFAGFLDPNGNPMQIHSKT